MADFWKDGEFDDFDTFPDYLEEGEYLLSLISIEEKIINNKRWYIIVGEVMESSNKLIREGQDVQVCFIEHNAKHNYFTKDVGNFLIQAFDLSVEKLQNSTIREKCLRVCEKAEGKQISVIASPKAEGSKFLKYKFSKMVKPK